MIRPVSRLLAAAVAALLLAPVAPAHAAGTPYTKVPVSGSLSTYRVSGVYVAGVSSGAYLANQIQVAYSQRIRERRCSPPAPTTAPRTTSHRRCTAAATTSTRRI
ncbi:hypothetical protein GCM10029963_11000 [Micromonospora andamanensis]